jgi:hypothetical protein
MTKTNEQVAEDAPEPKSVSGNGGHADSASKSQDKKEEKKQPLKWWQNPTTVILLVAIVAAVPPVTAGVQEYIQAQNRLQLENKKHLHLVRQTYLERFLTEKQNRRVLEFLSAVEDDGTLKTWALAELAKTNTRIEEIEKRYASKKVLYAETTQLVSRLAHSAQPVEPNSDDFKRFIQLYEGGLISVESTAVEGLMVAYRQELEKIISDNDVPGRRLKDLAFQLALMMKQERRTDEQTPVPTAGITGTTGPYIQFPEFTAPRRNNFAEMTPEELVTAFEEMSASETRTALLRITDYELPGLIRKIYSEDPIAFERLVLQRLSFDDLANVLWRMIRQMSGLAQRTNFQDLHDDPKRFETDYGGLLNYVENSILARMTQLKESTKGEPESD